MSTESSPLLKSIPSLVHVFARVVISLESARGSAHLSSLPESNPHGKTEGWVKTAIHTFVLLSVECGHEC